jgi:tetratricopeptide (TPR) repeat protein
MAKWSILFLSCLPGLFCSAQTLQQKTCDCASKKVQDSLIERYIDMGAQQLPNIYNDPRWITYCDSVISLCPGIAYAYQQKAIPFIKNGDYATAFVLENKSVELEPQTYTSYRGFVKCIFTKDYEGAIIDFQQAQQLSPDGYEMDHTYLFWIGVCNLELGNYPAAEKDLRQDIFIQTKGDTTKTAHFNTLFYMGVLYFEMKNYALAKSYLSACLAQYKEHTNANYYLALVYHAEKNYDQEMIYLRYSKNAFEQGYGISEDNVYYANYPHQVRLYEVEQALTGSH